MSRKKKNQTATPEVGVEDSSLEEEIVVVPEEDEAPEGEPKTEMGLLVDRLATTKEAAEADYEYANPRTRPGLETLKRQAQEQLKELEQQHASVVKQGLAAIFVFGDKEVASSFAKVAQEEGGTIIADAEELYRRIAEEVEPFMRTDRSFEPTQFAHVIRAVSDIGKELGLDSVPSPRFHDGAVLHDFSDLVAHIRYLVRDVAGDTLNAFYLHKRIAEAALAIRYQKSVVPVVLIGAAEVEVDGLSPAFNGKTVEVTAEEGFTTEDVLNAFNELKKKIKG